MSGQLAKLFIRGSLINVTAKNLTEEQKVEVEKLMNQAWHDKKLENARHEFCNALERTIGNEYKNKEFAMAEARITFWRTAVDCLYHNPKPRVVEDPIIRKKHFQTCMFNYLRQILAENKIPSYRHVYKVSGGADYVAKEVIQFYLENLLTKPVEYNLETNKVTNIVTFDLDVNMIHVDLMKKVWKLRDEIRDYGVQIVITDSTITVIPKEDLRDFVKKVSEKVRVRSMSLSGFDENDNKGSNFQQHCEYKARKKREVEMDGMLVEDLKKELSQRLPNQNRAKDVFDILMNPPQDFLDTYYPRRKKEVRPKETHIAKYLGISKSEVENAMKTIRQQAIALDIR